MKKNIFVLFILCNVLELCAAFTPDSSPQASRNQSPSMRVKHFIGETHYFKPTLRYFAHANSVVRPLSHCLAIVGVAAYSAEDVGNFKRAATLAPLSSKKSMKDNLLITKDFFEQISKKNAEHVKYQITLAIICSGQLSIGHAYGMCTPEPKMRFEMFDVKGLKGREISLPLKVIGKKAVLPDLIVHLLQRGDYANAQELLSAAELKSLCVKYGGILHLNIPACLALFK